MLLDLIVCYFLIFNRLNNFIITLIIINNSVTKRYNVLYIYINTNPFSLKSNCYLIAVELEQNNGHRSIIKLRFE